MSSPRPVEVVAAAITDARGRVLLARRTVGRDLAGLWEFPGGKVEPGETPEHALVRELREELGIQVQPGSHITTVPQAYPAKRLRLEVRAQGPRGPGPGLGAAAQARRLRHAAGRHSGGRRAHPA